MKCFTSAFVGLLLVAFLLVAASSPSHTVEASQGGGTPCAGCTMILTIVLDLAAIHNKAVDKALEDYCSILPPPIANPCIDFLDKYGALLVKLVAEGASSDDICQSLGVCTLPQCRLFPQKKGLPFKRVTTLSDETGGLFQWIEDAINRFANLHDPVFDVDGDFFSDTGTFRGAYWRGKDCDPLSGDVYPGRNSTTLPPEFDHNCNGIKGSNRQHQSYEDLYCGSSDPRGVIILGDSATAHFRLPPQYLNASAITASTYDHVLFWGENEFDWPHRSWGTGHLNDTTGDCTGPLQSIYLQMRQRNLCNHRDFQNIGVNGARSGAMQPPGIIDSMARKQTSDHPALVFYALVGNDVCHSSPSTSAFTTPQEFEQNVLGSLNYLDANLPPNSHVVFVGLVDGRVLWDTMHNRTHPIGCTYPEFYDYLNCLEISPCWGWLNSNATVRDETSAAAKSLNQVYKQIIAQYTFKNFDMVYYDFPLIPVFTYWIAKGGAPYELIEPSDGFHPSQITNALVAEYLFGQLERDHPDFIGPVNPNNAQIQSLFGDQGGY
eukprot:CAMPEP_0184336098 /NCGR_PEP_ID=MMETSP1089-20130417/4522_1 /TAXON_ID=38269 ORGANISM="Gloeochaete wittrockiana, Strain SAG46.84" /NCGR_SAMPLE_ID=MMETSP1089 /ASSEMBLY_ACC=CAM_ASM_000445 /LENGTH=547 /DNA_ID=CAMNT_0026661037 /DNA_START=11 /DNA_END=1654 /DNA_ORIENTATION=-